MDFTTGVFRKLLASLLDWGYGFMTVGQAFQVRGEDNSQQIILRHDVDQRPENSLVTARIEYDLGIRGTYYFRVTPNSFNGSIMSEISSLGHEIGYHYEDMELARQRVKFKIQDSRFKIQDSKFKIQKLEGYGEAELAAVAIESFRENLAGFRELAEVDTICMHGTPLSPVDSRLLWKYYDYHDYGILAEPYFDFTLEKMLYLTDTGRQWNGEAVSIRDKVFSRPGEYYESWKRKPASGSAMQMTEQSYGFQKGFRFRSTGDIMMSGRSGKLPRSLMITFHPQRWSEGKIRWLQELVAQNAKNQIKYLINRFHVE